jgi:hypothetical protein
LNFSGYLLLGTSEEFPSMVVSRYQRFIISVLMNSRTGLKQEEKCIINTTIQEKSVKKYNGPAEI